MSRKKKLFVSFIMICFISLISLNNQIYSAETTNKQVDTLTPMNQDYFYYTSVFVGKKLEPQQFKESIETFHHLQIKNISFAKNQRANTSKIGTYATTLEITTTDGSFYELKAPYLVQQGSPTISLYNIDFHPRKKRLTLSSSSPEVALFISDNGKEPVYKTELTHSKNFETKWSKPSDYIQIVAADKKGNYSDIITYFMPSSKKDKQPMIKEVAFDPSTKKLSGTTESGTTLVATTNKEKKELNVSGSGTFEMSLAECQQPLTLTSTRLDKTESHTFVPDNLTNDGSHQFNQLQVNAKNIDLAHESIELTRVLLVILLVFGIIVFFIIKIKLASKRQN